MHGCVLCVWVRRTQCPIHTLRKWKMNRRNDRNEREWMKRISTARVARVQEIKWNNKENIYVLASFLLSLSLSLFFFRSEKKRCIANECREFFGVSNAFYRTDTTHTYCVSRLFLNAFSGTPRRRLRKIRFIILLSRRLWIQSPRVAKS